MVCAKNSNKHSTEITPTDTKLKALSSNMDFVDDNLELQHLAGGSIVKNKPLFSENGSYLFVRLDKIVQVYATSTGELIRELTGAADNLISMELELKEPEILVACTCEGDLLRWHWRTGVLRKTLKLKLIRNGPVVSCNLINMYTSTPTAAAFVVMKLGNNSPLRWWLVDTTNGERINVPKCTLPLQKENPIIAVGLKQYKYIVVAQSSYIYFLNYTTWQWVRYKSAHLVPFTAVVFSPTEELVATGDEGGRIFLWRQFDEQKKMRNTLYHWHHTVVTSIAFSGGGTSFFSSGLEAVLVRWNINQTNLRNFLPRLSSNIRHIAVSESNELVAVCTDDNGVQFLSANDSQLKTTLQNFTFANDEDTGKSIFPIGMCLEPRSSTLVLNGKIGHLQFYSTHNKNLLYNLRVVDQNKLSMEREHIIYNIRVTKAAFNIDWMATGEVLNDEERLPELRLKFWRYNENLQKYLLHTNIEMPHENGFKAIVFSNENKVDNILCATLGEDNVIKMWSPEDSENIYVKNSKAWTCIAQTQYRNMNIDSICFSQDGSLLAAGYGNTLCIYKSETLKLRAALNGTAGMDGTVAKAQIRLAKQTMNGAKNEFIEQRKTLWQLFKRVLNTNDAKLIKELQDSIVKTATSTDLQPTKSTTLISEKHKAQIYTKICDMHELNLYQKLQLMQKFNIRCQVQPKCQTKMAAYLQYTINERRINQRTQRLHAKLLRINNRQRYKAKYRLQQYTTRKRHYDNEITQQLIPIMSMLDLTDKTIPKSERKISQSKNLATEETATPAAIKPPHMPAEITRVQFAAGEHAHLVVVCTNTRVLIWNLLTLRLQSVLKLSVRHMSFDAQTNLIAACTKNNELHVFQPNVPLPIYQRANLPKLCGMIWIPRRQPKQRSINVDWQAYSTLYFLTDAQEIKYLAPPDADETELSTTISFAQPAPAPTMQYTAFGALAAQQQTSAIDKSKQMAHIGPLIQRNGKDSTANTFINLSSHTMPPLHMLCGEFVKSLLKKTEPIESERYTVSTLSNGKATMNGHGLLHGSDNEDNEEDIDMAENIERRKTILYETERKLNAVDNKIDVKLNEVDIDLEKELQRVANLSIMIDL